MSTEAGRRRTAMARWARKRPKLDRYVREVREAGAAVTLPERWDLPPELRSGQPDTPQV